MIEKDQAITEFKAYETVREAFYNYLDEMIPAEPGTTRYDFDKAQAMDPKRIYELFFALDYQARKVRGVAMNLLQEREEKASE